jgi:hypothetical protein
MSDVEETQTMVRTQVAVDDVAFLLAQGQSIEDIKDHVEHALHAGGGFVDFVVVGNRATSILITPSSRVVVSVETVQLDSRDAGDDAAPYGGVFDML